MVFNFDRINDVGNTSCAGDDAQDTGDLILIKLISDLRSALDPTNCG